MCRVSRNNSIVSSSEEFATLVKLLTEDDIDIMPSQEQSNRKRRKRVSFNNNVDYSAPSNLTREELRSLWHDSETISTFKSNVRKLVLFKHKDNISRKTPQVDIECRGLESCTYERQLQRHRTIQCIVSAYKKGMATERTAEIAQKCSAWNRDVAVLQACHDFFEVHQPDLTLPHIDNTPPEFPFQLKRAANTVDSNTTEERRVRRRTT